jgi:hypothetical protein
MFLCIGTSKIGSFVPVQTPPHTRITAKEGSQLRASNNKLQFRNQLASSLGDTVCPSFPSTTEVQTRFGFDEESENDKESMQIGTVVSKKPEPEKTPLPLPAEDNQVSDDDFQTIPSKDRRARDTVIRNTTHHDDLLL